MLLKRLVKLKIWFMVRFGKFNLIVWRDKVNDEYHFSLGKAEHRVLMNKIYV